MNAKPVDSISTLKLGDGQCIEVCDGDRLVGYAIFFSGRWDAWAMTARRGHRALSRHGTVSSAEEAVEIVTRNYWSGAAKVATQ